MKTKLPEIQKALEIPKFLKINKMLIIKLFFNKIDYLVID